MGQRMEILYLKKSKTAIRQFQKVYGLAENGRMNGATKNKLSAAYAMKSKIMNSAEIANIIREYYGTVVFSADNSEDN